MPLIFTHGCVLREKQYRKTHLGKTFGKEVILLMKNIIKYLTIFFVGAVVYMSLEILWRGYTHWTMGVVGGICVILIGLINEIFSDTPLMVQAPIASMIITELEYISGYILNIQLGLNIWDYSQLPFNVEGQVCLYASILWMVLGILAVIIDDRVRQFFGEAPVKYRLI